MADDVLARLDVGRDGGRPSAVGLVHELRRAPDAVFIDGFLGEFDEFELVHVDSSDVALVWRHPGRDWSLVAVKPTGPVEGHAAAGASLGDETGGGLMNRVAGNVGAGAVEDRTSAASPVGNPGWSGGERRVDEDVIARVAVEANGEEIGLPWRRMHLHSIVRRDAVNVPVGEGLGHEGQNRDNVSFHCASYSLKRRGSGCRRSDVRATGAMVTEAFISGQPNPSAGFHVHGPNIVQAAANSST